MLSPYARDVLYDAASRLRDYSTVVALGCAGIGCEAGLSAQYFSGSLDLIAVAALAQAAINFSGPDSENS